MKTDIQLSTRFLQSQGAHQIGLLVSVGADHPPARRPINVALVLDRSGSMDGEPIRAAIEAACRFAGYLGAKDRISVVAFDSEVNTVVAGAPGGSADVETAIRRLYARGNTNLSGGWLKGHELVENVRVEGVNRVVLFTDGQANAGITDNARIASLVLGASGRGVGTSCFGFGPHFHEGLLKAMSNAGRGNFWYIETSDQMGPVFDEEIEGLVSLTAQNVEIEVRPLHAGVHGVTLIQDLPATRNTTNDGWLITLGDVYATRPRELGLRFHVESPEALGRVTLAEVRLKADAIRPEGIERTSMTLPVVANLDGTDHVEPVVDRTLLRFDAARSRAKAVEDADAGRFDTAARALREAVARLLPFAKDAVVAEEIVDLTRAAEDMQQRKYGDDDRHYHLAQVRAQEEGKIAYGSKIRRKPRPTQP